jgi:hypothetical protein
MTDHASECDLITCLFAVQLIDNMAGVGPRDDRVKLRMDSQRLVHNGITGARSARLVVSMTKTVDGST